jgi:hypothetical protein
MAQGASKLQFIAIGSHNKSADSVDASYREMNVMPFRPYMSIDVSKNIERSDILPKNPS